MRRKGIGIGGVAMLVIAATFLVFLVATRFGLDIFGPHLVEFMRWVHDETGLLDGVQGTGR